MILRIDLSEVWRLREVNCLQKALEMDFDLLKVLGPKEMGWLGGVGEILPERDLRRAQWRDEFRTWLDWDRVSSHC